MFYILEILVRLKVRRFCKLVTLGSGKLDNWQRQFWREKHPRKSFAIGLGVAPS